MKFREPALSGLRGGDSKRPSDDEDSVAEEQLFAGKPVDDHLRHQHDEDRAAGAAEQAAEEHRVEIFGDARNEAADNHRHHPRHHDLLVAEAPAEKAAGERDRNAGKNESAHQHTDLRVVDAKIADQERGYGTGRLKLITQGKARHEKHGENEPATVA